MTDTPETDAHIEKLRRDPELSGCDKTLELARKLERERDAALRTVTSLLDAIAVSEAGGYTNGDCPCCHQYHVCTPTCPVEAAKAIVHSIEQ